MINKFIPGSSLQGKNGRNGTKFPIALIVLFLLIAAFIFRLAPIRFLESSSSGIARPILFVKNWVVEMGASFFSLLYSSASLLEENQTLREKLATLEGAEAELKMLKEQNVSILGIASSILSKKDISVSVILRSPETPYDTIILDGGENMNFKEGNRFYGGSHILLGKILEVFGNTSKARFFSAPGEITKAAVGVSSIPIELTGRGGGNFIARLPKGADVEEGDSIFLLGGDDKLIGIVGAIIPVPNDSFVDVLVRVPLNIFELSRVFVEK